MKTKPRVLSRHIAAQTRIFQVEAVDLEFANGNRRRYERILGGRGSVMVVPLHGDTLLLTREYAAGFDRYELGFPKGVVDPGEEPAEAANRELQEEVGFAARRVDLIQTVSLAPGYIQHVTHILLARDLYEQTATGDEPEPVEVVPWPLANADALLTRPDFSEARAIAAIWLVRRFLEAEAGTRPPFSPS